MRDFILKNFGVTSVSIEFIDFVGFNQSTDWAQIFQELLGWLQPKSQKAF